MKQILTLSLVIILATLIGLLSVATALAQTGGGYDLSWSTVDGGGGQLTGSGYTLAGTIGQPDAGSALIGGGYSLTGGFWPGAASGSSGGNNSVYLPVILKNF